MSDRNSNILLEKLPVDYRKSLEARTESVTLPVGTVVYEPGQVPRYAHFMTSGMTSIVTFMSDGWGAEVGLVGNEGVVEAVHLLGPERVVTKGTVQVAGTALRMLFTELQCEFQKHKALRDLILRLVQNQGQVLAQLAACNRLHEVEARLARWLLMVQDRVKNDVFPMTHEFIAQMLGAQRTTVTLAAGSLQRSGLIEYRRGRMHLVDQTKLENAACECTGVTRRLYGSLYN